MVDRSCQLLFLSGQLSYPAEDRSNLKKRSVLDFLETGHQALSERARRSFDAIRVEPLTHCRFRAREVGEWCFSWLEGDGTAEFNVKRAGEAPFQRALLTLMLSGRSRRGDLDPGPIDRPGEIALIRKKVQAEVQSGEFFRYLCVQIPVSALAKNRKLPSPDNRVISAYQGGGAVVSATVRALASEVDNQTLAVRPYLTPFAKLVAEAFFNPDRSIQPNPRRNRYQRICDYVRVHAQQQGLSATKTAKACGVSMRQLSRVLSDHDQDFRGLLREARLDIAAEALIADRTQRSIGEIAFDAGFANASYFSRASTNRFGEPPSAYRQKNADS